MQTGSQILKEHMASLIYKYIPEHITHFNSFLIDWRASLITMISMSRFNNHDYLIGIEEVAFTFIYYMISYTYIYTYIHTHIVLNVIFSFA